MGYLNPYILFPNPYHLFNVTCQFHFGQVQYPPTSSSHLSNGFPQFNYSSSWMPDFPHVQIHRSGSHIWYGTGTRNGKAVPAMTFNLLVRVHFEFDWPLMGCWIKNIGIWKLPSNLLEGLINSSLKIDKKQFSQPLLLTNPTEKALTLPFRKMIVISPLKYAVGFKLLSIKIQSYNLDTSSHGNLLRENGPSMPLLIPHLYPCYNWDLQDLYSIFA